MDARHEPETGNSASDARLKHGARAPRLLAPDASLKRLNFTLPTFLRIAWVSEEVRNVYEPKIRSIAQAWSEIEWRSVPAGIRQSALCVVYADFYETFCAKVVACGLEILPLRVEERSTSQRSAPGKQVLLHVFVGKRKNAKAFKSAWIRRDSDRLGELLGYPECCREFIRRCRANDGLADMTWPIAGNTKDAKRKDRTIVVSGSPLLNILLRRVNVRALPHLPCRFDCPNSQALANQWTDLGRSLGFREEMEWLTDILSWPAEWSALHGIAEIRSPILKACACTQTDATAQKYAVRWLGNTYPANAPRGVVFPYDAHK